MIALTNGIESVDSSYSVEETVARVKAALERRGVTLFAVVDHAGEAARVGLKMPPTVLLIFGNPVGGTPLMQAAPSTALDLPMKLLVAEVADGTVLLSWNDPAWLQLRHGFPEAMTAKLAVVEVLAREAASV